MSHYVQLTMSITNRQSAVDALQALGFTAQQIEIHDEPQLLYTYNGQPSKFADRVNGDKAHVIVRRHNMGRSQNDFGILFKEDEDAQLFCCDYTKRFSPAADSNRVAEHLHGKDFLPRFEEEYAFAEFRAEHEAQGLIVQRAYDEETKELFAYADMPSY